MKHELTNVFSRTFVTRLGETIKQGC